MTQPQNPLTLLTDYLDPATLGDPRMLAHMVKRQKRMLLNAYHPESNIKGPLTKEDAEARFKAVNDNRELGQLIKMLELLSGERQESYQGERGTAQGLLAVWISGYTSRKTDAVLQGRYAAALKEKEDIAEALRTSRDRISELERKLDEATSRHGGYSPPETIAVNISADLKGSIESILSSASYFAQDSRYERMRECVQQAREQAQRYNVDFDRAFNRQISEVIGTYIGRRLSSAAYYAPALREEAFTHSLDAAVTAADDFARRSVFMPEIRATAEIFVDAAISRGRYYLSQTEPLRRNRAPDFFRMAERVGARYGLVVDIRAS